MYTHNVHMIQTSIHKSSDYNCSSITLDHVLISLGHDARTITSVGNDASMSMKKLVLNDNTKM